MKNKFDIITGKSFDQPDETRRPFEKGKIEIVVVGDLTFYHETFESGCQ